MVPTDFFNKLPKKGKLERSKEESFEFAKITASRLFELYKKFYEDCNFTDLLDFSEIYDKRRMLFEKMQEKFPQCKGNIYYTIENNGLQYKLQNTTDWSRPWLACGIPVNHSEQPYFICIASNGNTCEIGKRRHPDHALIYEKNLWWFPDENVEVFESFTDQKLEVDVLFKKFSEFLSEI